MTIYMWKSTYGWYLVLNIYIGIHLNFSSIFVLQKLLIASRNLEFFTNGYRYLIQILPAAVVAPMYFSGKIEFGVINQSVSAFNHILSDFSLIVYQFQAISAFSAVIERLGEMLVFSITRVVCDDHFTIIYMHYAEMSVWFWLVTTC